MTLRRLPPLAIAIALVAAALVVTIWVTSRTIGKALASAGDGHALAILQSVRGDLAELGGEPSPEDLAEIAREHAGDGLAYLALLDNRGDVVAHAGGDARGAPPPGFFERERRGRWIQHVDGRVRIDAHMMFRRRFAAGPRLQEIAIEVAPVEAEALRAAALRTFAIVGLAALTLLGVAIGLTRRELRRSAELAGREREKRLASLGEMSAVLAHEMKNPLASLKGNAQLLAAMLPGGETLRAPATPAEAIDPSREAQLRGPAPPAEAIDPSREAQLRAKAKANRVVDEAVRLEKLMADLLAFVRTGALQRAPVAPATIAHDVASSAAAATNADVRVDDRGAPQSWSLDAGRLREVLVNLVDNAIAAGPPVELRVFAERRALVLEVVDRGPGVPPADREKIFEPFFTGKTRGTGLGLAIAKRMVELHGGTIAVLDAEGGGARFRIEIPEA